MDNNKEPSIAWPIKCAVDGFLFYFGLYLIYLK